jgi:RHS repeat-associated protein
MTPAPTVAYDANGNTLSDSSGKSYSWDFENRLTQAVVPGTNGGTTTFRYDPFGRRIQKSGPLGITNYLYDGIDSLDDVDQNGSVLARYSPGVWIDEPLAELAAATTGYYQADVLGSVSSISSSTGALLNTYTYDSFGKLTASTGTFANRFQYIGREFDPETVLYFYRARDYDMNIGRFISEDPIRFKAGTNFYKYVNNSPLNAADPTGFCPPGPLPTPCRCSGSGGAPFVGVCKLQCTCGGSVDDYYFTLSGLKRNCGWAGKTCPATIEGVQTTGFGGDKVVLPQKCYGLQ